MNRDHISFAQLIPFLHDKNPQVRQIALANLLGHSNKESPHRAIFLDGLRSGGLQHAQDNDVLRSLKLLCRDQLVNCRCLCSDLDDKTHVGIIGDRSRCIQGIDQSI